ncbi:hypothetical protein IAT38_002648 [Cryptococcus sp. DSM 104549]
MTTPPSTLTGSSLASRTSDLINKVEAATGQDLFAPFADLTKYVDDFPTATDGEKRYIAKAIEDEWSLSGMDLVTNRKPPRSLCTWTDESRWTDKDGESIDGGPIRQSIQDAVSTVKSSLRSMGSLSLEGNEALRGELADLMDDGCRFYLRNERDRLIPRQRRTKRNTTASNSSTDSASRSQTSWASGTLASRHTPISSPTSDDVFDFEGSSAPSWAKVSLTGSGVSLGRRRSGTNVGSSHPQMSMSTGISVV